MTEDQRKHLEFIQNSITRTNSNSFQIKGVAVTIVAALLGIYASNNKLLIIFMGIPPTILFWFLDAYYLQVEKKLRGIYNDVAAVTTVHTVAPYAFPLKQYTGKDFSYFKTFKSKSVLPLYISIIVFLTLLGLYLNYFSSQSC